MLARPNVFHLFPCNLTRICCGFPKEFLWYFPMVFDRIPTYFIPELQAIKKRLRDRCFPVNAAKLLGTVFNIENLRWLLLQVLYQKAVSKNFTDFITMYRYQSTFLSSCKSLTGNFAKRESSVQVLSCKFCEISRNNFMQNNFEGMLPGVKRCCVK